MTLEDEGIFWRFCVFIRIFFSCLVLSEKLIIFAEKRMIEIETNIYEHDLLGLFWGYEPKDEEDRVQHWAKAYYYYFKGDIVIASHLLMPQFEHALHNLLEEIVEDVTKLNEQVQKEPTLIKVLNELKPYCNSTLHDELTMFFVDGNDVNYRNRLLHGLMGSMDMLRYGHYMFYLANLLYFKGRKFLEMGEEYKRVNQYK